jgi:hypothetical protein
VNDRVFVNYRGKDSHSYGAMLYNVLAYWFGADQVFLDAESIPAGADYVTELLQRVRSARVVLAVIGPRWLTDTDHTDPARCRQIDDPADWIRRELVEAFTHGVKVIPVLVDNAVVPTEAELPADIAALSRCQARPLRRRESSTDLARIADDLAALDPILGAARTRQPPGQLSGLRDVVDQPILAFLVNFDIYLKHVGDLQAQLDLIPQGMWPIIDSVAYGKADTFLQQSGLGDVQPPGGTVDIREALAFSLKLAWERGYFMAHFHRLDYIPRPVHPIDPKAIMDLIIAKGDPAHPDRSLGNAIEVSLQRAVSLSTEPEPVVRHLRMLGDHLIQTVQPHLDLWRDTIRTTHAYGILAAKAETEINGTQI